MRVSVDEMNAGAKKFVSKAETQMDDAFSTIQDEGAKIETTGRIIMLVCAGQLLFFACYLLFLPVRVIHESVLFKFFTILVIATNIVNLVLISYEAKF